ncbi:MAG: hypothetical protein KJS83_02415 [Xanthomonadaceae bacterium]|nr:hypothetical protein [Xanthomonadaceae bacterium]
MKQKAMVVALTGVLAACAVAVSATAAETSPPDYSIIDLPSLGGTASQGSSINTFGLIAGYSNLPGNQVAHAAAWWFGSKYDLDTLGGANSAVEWPVKNEFGVISGIAQTSQPNPPGEHWSCQAFFNYDGHTCLGFVWKSGKMIPLQPLPGGYNSFATGTNNRFQTVGWAETGFHDPSCNSNPDDGFVQVLQFLPVTWGPNPGQIGALPLEAGDDSGAATAVNDSGEVVGISGSCDQAVGRYTARHMVLWKDGKAIDLGNIGGDAWNTPMAINRQGDVVGFAGITPGPNPVLHAFFRGHAGGPPVDLGVLQLGDISEALGINDRGQVVGLSCGPGETDGCHGFLWQDGVMTDLDSFAPNYQGVLEDAQDINDLGQITGQALDASGNLVAFLATPVPGYGNRSTRTTHSNRGTLSRRQRVELARRLGLAGVAMLQSGHP